MRYTLRRKVVYSKAAKSLALHVMVNEELFRECPLFKTEKQVITRSLIGKTEPFQN